MYTSASAPGAQTLGPNWNPILQISPTSLSKPRSRPGPRMNTSTSEPSARNMEANSSPM
jgi:hypothetical protein